MQACNKSKSIATHVVTKLFKMEKTIQKNGTTIGAILGSTLILITAVMYAVDLNLFTNAWIGFFTFMLAVGFGIYSCYSNKRLLKGIMSYREAFTSFIVPIIVGTFMNVLFYILLFNVIDTAAKEQVSELVIEYTENMMSSFRVPESEIEKAIEELREKDNLSIFAQLKSYLTFIVIYALVGFLVALGFKTPKRAEV